MSDAVVQLVGVFLSVLLGAGGLGVSLISRKKQRADVRFIDSQTESNYATLANSWIDRLESKVKSLEDEITELKKMIQEYETRIFQLLKDLGKDDGNV